MKRGLGLLVIVTSCALVVMTTVSATEEKEEKPKINECRDASGNVVFQDDPCTDPPRESVKKNAVRRSPAPQGTGRREMRSSMSRALPVLPARPAYPSRSFEQPAHAVPPAGFGDPRFSSPETTWKTFVAAVRDGDRSVAVACLMSTALTELGNGADAFPLEKMRGMVDGFTRIELGGEAGPFWCLRALRPNRRPKWIFLERTARGDWKISAI